MVETTYPVMIDEVRYHDKTSASNDVPRITNRMKTAGYQLMTAEQLARAIAEGRTWCAGCFDPNASVSFGSSEFHGMRLYALDFDNDTPVLGDDGTPVKDANGRIMKRSLLPYESGYIDPYCAVYKFHAKLGSWPLMAYATLSYKCDGTIAGRFSPETRMKFRIVYDLGDTVTDRDRAQRAVTRVLDIFPEADRKCVNLGRLFFGSCGLCTWFESDGRAHRVTA